MGVGEGFMSSFENNNVINFQERMILQDLWAIMPYLFK